MRCLRIAPKQRQKIFFVQSYNYLLIVQKKNLPWRIMDAFKHQRFSRHKSFYFAANFQTLSAKQSYKGPQSVNLKFSINEGLKIVSKTKNLIPLTLTMNSTASLNNASLVFHLKEYSPEKKNDFVLKMNSVGQSQEEKEIGAVCLRMNECVEDLLQKNEPYKYKKVEIGDFVIDLCFITDSDRLSLSQRIRKFQEQQSNSFLTTNNDNDSPLRKSSTFGKKRNLSLKIKHSFKNRPKDPTIEIIENDSPLVKKNRSESLYVTSKPKETVSSLKREKEEVIHHKENFRINLRVLFILLVSIVLISLAVAPTRKAFKKKNKKKH